MQDPSWQPTYMPSPSVVPTDIAKRPVWWMWFRRITKESVLPLFIRMALFPVSEISLFSNVM